MNPTIQSIKNRRSTRVFLPDQIDNQHIEAIVEAGLFAPSAMNAQPWHVTVVQNQTLLASINTDAKQALATHENEYFKKFASNENLNVLYHAPTAIVISAVSSSPIAQTDCAAMAQNMLLAAESLDVGSCWIGLANFALKGEKAAQYAEQLRIPEGYTPCFTIALGHKKTSTTTAPPRKENAVNYIR